MILTAKRILIGVYPSEYFYLIGKRWSLGFYKFKLYGIGFKKLIFKW